MLTIGDERYAVDTLAHGNLVLGQEFVARDTHQCCCHTEGQLRGWCTAGQLEYRFYGTCDGAGNNHQYDENTCQVFSTVVTIRVALVGCASGNHEGNPQGDRRQYITEIVQGIGKETCTASNNCNGKLDGRNDEHPCRRNLYSS